MKYPKLTKDLLIKEYIISKKSTRQIANIIKTNKTTILNYLKKYNIETRTISEANTGKKLSEQTKHKISKAIKIKYIGSGNPNWHGGKTKDGNGYIYIYSPDHPYKNYYNYVYEHRLVMERHIGRYLKPEEAVHHKNEIVDDNRIENLRLFKNKPEHTKYHHKIKRMKNNEFSKTL